MALFPGVSVSFKNKIRQVKTYNIKEDAIAGMWHTLKA